MGRKDNLSAYIFLGPFLFVFTVFLLIPVIYSLYLSLFRVGPYTDLTQVFSTMEFAGLSNYGALFRDQEFLWSLVLTLLYGCMTIPGTILVSLALALLLNRELKGRGLFRSAFFLPNVLDMLVIGFAWQLIYSPRFGILTLTLDQFFNIKAFHETGFLGNPYYALPAIAIAMILKGSGFGMILFLASLGNISKSLYEAAQIDGANHWQSFLNITLPLLKPTILFLVVTGIMAALNGFTEIYAMTDATGGPHFTDSTGMFANETLGSTKISGFYLWKVFSFGRYGYAAAMSYILLLVALSISYLNARWLSPQDQR
jgi:multiple sugar transport system permease protein